MVKINWSQEQVDEICQSYENGKSSIELGKQYRCSYNTIIKILRREGVNVRRSGSHPSITQEEKQKIIHLYKEGRSQAKIGNILGYDKSTISRTLKKKKVSTRTCADYDIRKYSWNENYFDKIDTPNKAYWIGWLVSDGYVGRKYNRIKIQLAEKDRSILEKLNEEVASDRPILWTRKKNERCQNQVTLSLTSRHAIDVMQSYGLLSPKTFTVKFPDYIPEELIAHFIRGEFDGDGSCSTRKTKTKGARISSINVVGAEHLLMGIQDQFSKLGVTSKIHSANPKNKNNIRRLRVSSRENILKVRDYLYPKGDYLYLKRKRDKFFELA